MEPSPFDKQPEEVSLHNETSSFQELELQQDPQLVDAVRLFILRSGISQRNSKFLIDLLKIVQNMTLNNPNCKIPSYNQVINPLNRCLLKNIELCSFDNSPVEDGKCSSCAKRIVKPTRSKVKIQAKHAGDVFQGITYKDFNPEQEDLTLT